MGVNKKDNAKFLNEDIKKSLPFKLLVGSLIVLSILIVVFLIVNFSGVVEKKEEFEVDSSLGSVGIFGDELGFRIILPTDCSEENIKASWDEIFKESGDGIIVNSSLCPQFSAYKYNDNGEFWIIFSRPYNNDIIIFIYASVNQDNISSMITSIESADPINTEFIDYLERRDIIDINQATNQFAINYVPSGNNWIYDSISTTPIYYFNDSYSDNIYKYDYGGSVMENKSYDVFFSNYELRISQINPIHNFSTAQKGIFVEAFDLDGFFCDCDLNYNITNLGNNEIFAQINNENILSFNVNVNFTGDEAFKVTAYDSLGSVESNIFYVKALPDNCTENDRGINISFKSFTQNGSTNGTDSCYNNSHVLEFYCSNKSVLSGVIPCLANYYCFEGACIINSSVNRTPVFLSDNCDISIFTWFNDAIKTKDISECFSDPDRDSMRYRFYNSNSNIIVNLTGSTLRIEPKNKWYGSGSLTIYANDSLHETSATINFQINNAPILINLTNTTNIPTPNNQIVKISNPIPNVSEISESENKNLTFAIGNRFGDLDSIKWYLDNELINNNSNIIVVRGLKSGNYTIEVVIKRGVNTDTRMWNLNIVTEKPEKKFVFDSGKVVLYLIFVVVIMVIIMIVWLFVQENNRKNKKLGLDLGSDNKKDVFISSKTSNSLNLPR